MKGPYTEPLYIPNKPPDSLQLYNSSVDYEEVEHQESVEKLGRMAKKLFNDDEDIKVDSNESKPGSPFSPQTLSSELKRKKGNNITTIPPEHELSKLERGEVSFVSNLFSCVWSSLCSSLLTALLFDCRFLLEQSVPASVC